MVKIRVGLARDGHISGGPLVVNRQHLADPYFRSAAEAGFARHKWLPAL